jgi:hypothetical protein
MTRSTRRRWLTGIDRVDGGGLLMGHIRHHAIVVTSLRGGSSALHWLSCSIRLAAC